MTTFRMARQPFHLQAQTLYNLQLLRILRELSVKSPEEEIRSVPSPPLLFPLLLTPSLPLTDSLKHLNIWQMLTLQEQTAPAGPMESAKTTSKASLFIFGHVSI